MRRFLLATALLCATLSGLAGCKGPCRELSEKLCDCSINSVEKEICLQNASREESRVEPTPEQEAVCETKLAGCDCKKIETAEGKRECGIAREGGID
ncbi:hypothetical protein SAMN05443572_1011047 [Myxococcus fulvus]|uniref:Lipoprotein n=1 Tax=Myxococcus fulvus TaxID=33 RepID=A0A511SV31_MYXFU|nr:hypothetical protein [Myxococcus fulvus]AKF79762.1 hypothetical protein MFUL124B02_06180 [Myxococcus fulvus 124B02]GEN05407.1 hypothetical protein MFU01_04440 [Myxococcus fulvus]SET08076.1 hypothetical protein SAMN05443572_1011047 [Myxococcus fulvus]